MITCRAAFGSTDDDDFLQQVLDDLTLESKDFSAELSALDDLFEAFNAAQDAIRNCQDQVRLGSWNPSQAWPFTMSGLGLKFNFAIFSEGPECVD